MHIIHDEQISLVKRFFDNYVKPQYMKDLVQQRLASFEFQGNLPLKDIFLGQSMEKNMTKRNEMKMCFNVKAIKPYKICGGYLQRKCPYITEHCDIYPQVQGHKVTLRYQKRLPKIATQVLSTEDQEQQYEEEVHSYNIDSKLQPVFDSEVKPKLVAF